MSEPPEAQTGTHELWLIHGPHTNDYADSVFHYSPQSIQMSGLVAALPAPLSRFPCSTPLPCDCVSPLPAVSPSLFLHTTGLSKADRVSGGGWQGGHGTVGWGITERERLGDNNSSLSQLFALFLKAQGQLWNQSQKANGVCPFSSHSASWKMPSYFHFGSQHSAWEQIPTELGLQMLASTGGGDFTKP